MPLISIVSKFVGYEENASKFRTQSIAEYYAGKKVFITGATGFLGKVLIERLLSSCTQIDSVYVLIREKEGQTIEARMKRMLDVPLFDKLKRLKPESLNKLVPIRGDIAEDRLAISQEDENTLIEDVSVVFHSAATVKFTDPFKKMINVNLEGTAKVLDLGKRMKNLDTFVYISTLFSNSNKPVIDEVIYPPPKPLDVVYKFIEKHGDNKDEIDKFLVGLPNTYTFSKALAETLVKNEHGHMKTIIIRPSIVTPALRSSLPGWCDSWVAATATFSDVARGLTRVIHGASDVACNMIPVDYVCNLTILAAARGNPERQLGGGLSDVARGLTRVINSASDVACNMQPVDYVCNLTILAAARGNPWVGVSATFSDVARGLTRVIHGASDVACNMIPVDYVCNLTILAAARGNPSNEVIVYHSCSDTTNSISWKRGADLFLEESLKHSRVPGALKPRKVAVSTSPLVVSCLTFTRQTVPAFLADLWLRVKGEKPRHMNMQKRAVLLRDLLRGFTSTKWVMKSDRAQQLIATMSEQDRALFPCDPKTINWKEYMKDFYSGVQKFMLNDK